LHFAGECSLRPNSPRRGNRSGHHDWRNIAVTLTTRSWNDGLIQNRKAGAEEKRQKWWSQHIPLAYAFLTGLFILIYLSVTFVDRRITGWLITLGASPSVVNLILGTASCGLGLWGIGHRQGLGTGWIVMFMWCLLGGILMLAKAFAFVENTFFTEYRVVSSLIGSAPIGVTSPFHAI
jgi:hypothetical protein